MLMPGYLIVDVINHFHIGFKMLSNQPNIHHGEEMVVTQRQVWTIRLQVENILSELFSKTLCKPQYVAMHYCAQEHLL